MSYTRPGMGGPAAKSGDFVEGIEELKKLIGRGLISGEIKVSQLYARRQEMSAHYAHPRGGQAFFLRDALRAEVNPTLNRVARGLYNGGIQADMITFVEHVASGAVDRMPQELGTLKGSTSTKVKVGGSVIFAQPARIAKLSRTALNRRIRQRHIDSAARRMGGS